MENKKDNKPASDKNSCKTKFKGACPKNWLEILKWNLKFRLFAFYLLHFPLVKTDESQENKDLSNAIFFLLFPFYILFLLRNIWKLAWWIILRAHAYTYSVIGLKLIVSGVLVTSLFSIHSALKKLTKFLEFFAKAVV